MQRIRMKDDAQPKPIYHNSTGQVLGTFLPGLGYWVTPENSDSAHAMVGDGHAQYEVADDAPLSSGGPISLEAAEGQLAGFLEVKD